LKKVMIHAYANFNLGDDLFIKVLCERYPNTQFTLYAPQQYKITFQNIENINIIPNDTLIVRGINFVVKKLFKKNNFYQYYITKKKDASVHIGGSLFMEDEKWRVLLDNQKSLKIPGKPFYLLGANFGPYKDTRFYEEYKELFKEYTDICFREKHSFSIFDELDNVRLADDIVFQLQLKNAKRVAQNPNIVISVIKPSVRKQLKAFEKEYYHKVRELAIYFIEKGYNVIFMSFCENEQDNEAIKDIIRLIPANYKENIFKHLYKFDINKSLEIIEQTNLVIATRFHSMILGMIYNKPTFPIIYSDKMSNVLNDINFTGSSIRLNEISKLEPKIVFDSMENGVIDISQQRKNAENHFEKLDEFLL
jgi:colanic acid/amylovoran biosynthesis protein